MHLDQSGAAGIEMRVSPLDADRLAVTSRRRALDRLWAAYRAGLCGPVLITGEPGAGKSWLVRRFAEGLPAGWGSAEVGMTSALDGLEMLRVVGDGLGLEMPDRLGAARLHLEAGLGDAAADGRGWLLVIDEVQHATGATWEELQALSARLGQPGGFAAMFLLGRTELARELATNRRRGWANRLGLHIHLPPLDLDDARALLRLEGRITEPELETLHRDTMGNPRAMLRIAAAWGRASRPAAARPPDRGQRPAPSRIPRHLAGGETRPRETTGGDDEPAGYGVPALADDAPARRPPSLIPARPPLRFEDGLVEVGWEGDIEAEATHPEIATSEPEAVATDEDERAEEVVEDRYAALQAWAEWSRNRERSAPVAGDPPAADVAPDLEILDPRPADPADDDSGPLGASSIRAEPPQEFAPYSQLFSRLRHSL
jgi:general secretion pathway protein A